jgi:hypothetical protein
MRFGVALRSIAIDDGSCIPLDSTKDGADSTKFFCPRTRSATRSPGVARALGAATSDPRSSSKVARCIASERYHAGHVERG